MYITLVDFLDCLFHEGRVRVPRPAEISDEELRAADRVLSVFERDYRQDLPGTPPPICEAAARWAVKMFYRACQYVVFRDAGEAVIARTMSAGCPEGDPASIHYSVDLVFHYLPDLFTLAQNASPGDPLVAHLTRWAVEWPLSSVGIPDVGSVQIDPWYKDSCLFGLYIDRVLARRDRSRLMDPRVREAVRQAVGLFPDLAPEMAAAVEEGSIPQDIAGEEVA